MLILGIESSCDDMAASVVEDGRKILSSIVSSQDDIHKKYGGIVPELASRRHIETVIPVVEEALKQAGVAIKDIDGIGVTQGPGLVGSILVGLSFAKAVAYAMDIPFVGVNHIEAHPMAVFLEDARCKMQDTGSRNLYGCDRYAGVKPAATHEPKTPDFPFIALVVSGGHTTLLKFKDFGDYYIIGQTRDDAAGEAFDKVAKLLGLGYPGGRVIDELAKQGNPNAIEFTRPYMPDTFDFSFSGLKTALLNYVKRHGEIKGKLLNDITASFQEAIVDVLVEKSIRACRENSINNLIISGGVACNSRLRHKLSNTADAEKINLFIPSPLLCTDNGATIAAAAYHKFKKGSVSDISMNAYASM
ncbi:MAG: tRNA (adenosine(37)-N6)-threonylcarbamoyltransferase complex transferase subunit TsaD [Deltaproteobacteria bacterium]|nr:tRNA (adenosine(37)-N6)-threonylcarbamoyltransferase complex transferase subunit TsaD [Deltaproteobacteria bacterium]